MSRISYSGLEKGIRIILNNQPYEITEGSFMFKRRGHSVLQTKLKNLMTGEIISETFHPSDSFEQAEISKIKAKFLYSHQEKFFFCQENNPRQRFDLTKERIGSGVNFLKQNQIVEVVIFKEKVINISLPIKIHLKVIQAPPGIKGDRAQAGNKTVILETGVEINVPLFIKEEDVVEVNTEKKEYVRRIEK